MAAIYTDENVSFRLVRALRAIGHDVLTARDDGRANQRVDDPDVLARAIELARAVLTQNRSDYHRLHRLVPDHLGFITYTHDDDPVALAARIDAAISPLPGLAGLLIRIVRPNPSKPKPTP